MRWAACLRVLYAGPGVTIQDSGRYGYLCYGVTPAGPIDWAAFETANLALGNDLRAAAIEISVGGLEVIAEGAPLWVAFAGGEFFLGHLTASRCRRWHGFFWSLERRFLRGPKIPALLLIWRSTAVSIHR